MTCSKYCVLIFVVAVVSCNQPRYIYSQNARNLHFFQKKGQAKVSAAWTTGPSRGVYGDQENYNHGADLQAAYAFAEKWALTGSYMSRKERDLIQVPNFDLLVSDVRYKRQAMEIGVSYFNSVDPKFATYFHIDGGAGWGRNQINDLGIRDSVGLNRYHEDNSFRLYLQPGLYTGRKAVRFGIGVRIQWSSYSNIKTDYTPLELYDYNLIGLNEILMIEPYAALRYGPVSVPWIKGELQFSFVSANTEHYIRGSVLSFGIVIDPSGKAR